MAGEEDSDDAPCLLLLWSLDFADLFLLTGVLLAKVWGMDTLTSYPRLWERAGALVPGVPAGNGRNP